MVAPERTINEDAQPPRTVAFEALRSDLAYAGEIAIEVPANQAPSGTLQAVLFVDGARANTCAGPPCTIRLDTRDFDDGPREIAVTYQTATPDPSIGLGALLGYGAVILRDTVTFDQSPPVPVEIVEAEWTPEGVRLRWESPEGANRNATQYRVVARQFGTQVGDAILLDAPASDALDPTTEYLIGDRRTYEVSVTNGVRSSPSSPLQTASSAPVEVTVSTPVGTQFECGVEGDPFGTAASYAWLQGRGELLALCGFDTGLNLRTYDLSSGTVSDPAPFAPLPAGGPYGFELVSTPDGEVAIVGESGRIPQTYVAAPLDVSTGQPGPWVTLAMPPNPTPDAARRALIPGGRVVLTDPEKRVRVFDLASGDLLQTLAEGPFNPTGPYAFLHAGQDQLVYLRNTEVLSLAVGDEPVQVTGTGSSPFSDPIRFAADATGRLYRWRSFGGSSRVEVVDPVTLGVVGSFSVAGGVGVTRLWGGLDGVYARTCGSKAGCQLVWLGHDGTERGRRPTVPGINSLVPTPTPGTFYVTADGFPFLDSIPD